MCKVFRVQWKRTNTKSSIFQSFRETLPINNCDCAKADFKWQSKPSSNQLSERGDTVKNARANKGRRLSFHHFARGDRTLKRLLYTEQRHEGLKGNVSWFKCSLSRFKLDLKASHIIFSIKYNTVAATLCVSVFDKQRLLNIANICWTF